MILKIFYLAKSRRSDINKLNLAKLIVCPTFNNKSLGLYCHVPFCAQKCSYCAFYQEQPTHSLIEDYLSCIKKECELLDIHQPFDTIYVGGGTPGILTHSNLEKLCRILTKNNNKRAPEEFSIEFSPITVKKEKIQVLKDYGCNRITIGIQSFNKKTMEALGRRQTNKQVFDAYETALTNGIENIGLDLIFGVPGQTFSDWLTDLQTAIKFCPKHISTYNLTFEDDTPLKNNLLHKKINKKSDDEEADFYLKTWKFLESNGYKQYEISNFCIKGFESRHNINTWKMQEWIGVGPSACSQFARKRFSNPSSIIQWENSIQGNKLAYTIKENISEKMLVEDIIIFGLRMNKGIDVQSLKHEFQSIDFSKLDELFLQLQHNSFLRHHGNFIALTTKGRLISDTIAVNILEIL